jgi:hypothetical protein
MEEQLPGKPLHLLADQIVFLRDTHQVSKPMLELTMFLAHDFKLTLMKRYRPARMQIGHFQMRQKLRMPLQELGI